MLEKMDEDQPTYRHSFAVLTNTSKQLQEDKKDGLFASGNHFRSGNSSTRLGPSISFLLRDCLNCSLTSSFGSLRVLGHSVLLCTTSETISYLVE